MHFMHIMQLLSYHRGKGNRVAHIYIKTNVNKLENHLNYSYKLLLNIRHDCNYFSKPPKEAVLICCTLDQTCIECREIFENQLIIISTSKRYANISLKIYNIVMRMH